MTHDKNGDALNFEKVLNGRNVAITIASTKKNTLSLKSARIFKNSGAHSPSANANALASTPKANSRNSTTNSILDSGEKINPKEENGGSFVYSYSAERTEEFSTRRTLLAAVNTRKGANGELFIDSIPDSPQKSKPREKFSLAMPAEGATAKTSIKDTEEGQRTLDNVYVLASAFLDGESIVPVKLEIKEFSDKENTLYVAIALESIKKNEIVK